MKTKINLIIILVFAISVFIIPQLAYADHGEFGIRIGDIRSESCEEADTCFIPSNMSVDVGSEITWINDSYISIRLVIEPQNIPNSQTITTGQIKRGTTYSMSSDVPGDYYYYSLEQPWAHGIITFEGQSHMEEEIPKPEELEPEIETMIPDWVRNNAGWWADGQIEDSDFVAGIQYLIENGIISI